MGHPASAWPCGVRRCRVAFQGYVAMTLVVSPYRIMALRMVVESGDGRPSLFA